MSYRETICFASIPARARSGVVCCKAAAALKAPSRSVSSPVYSFVFFCNVSAQSRTCSSNTALTSCCVIWHPSFEKWFVPNTVWNPGQFYLKQNKIRIISLIRCISGARQINPVVHQAHAGFVLPGYHVVGTFPVHGPLVLNLHAIRLIEAVFQVGNDTAERLQRLPL